MDEDDVLHHFKEEERALPKFMSGKICLMIILIVEETHNSKYKKPLLDLSHCF